jgi:hypothetical protein
MSDLREIELAQEAQLAELRKCTRRPIDKACALCVGRTSGVGLLWCIWFGTDACMASKEKEPTNERREADWNRGARINNGGPDDQRGCDQP